MDIRTSLFVPLLIMGFSSPATAATADDLALCRMGWWGMARTAACSRAIAAPDLSDLERAEAHYQRALSRVGRASQDDIMADLDASASLVPWHPAPVASRGDAYLRRGDFAKALAEYTAAIAIAPSARLFAARAEVHGKSGDGGRVITDLTEAIRLAPRDTNLVRLRGEALLKIGDAASAVADFESILQTAGTDDDVPALSGRAEGFLALEQFDRAIADADEVLKTYPASSARLVRAEAYLGKGDLSLALDDLNIALKGKSGSHRAYRLRATAHLRGGEVLRARKDIGMAVLLAPDDTGIKALAAQIETAAQAGGLPPVYPELKAAARECLMPVETGDNVPACSHLIAVDALPEASKALAHSIRGRFYYGRRDFARAAEDFKAGYAAGDRSAAAYTFLGLSLQELGQFGGAVANFKEGVAVYPTDAMMVASLARANARNDDCKAAVIAFSAAIKLAQSPPDYYGRANCHGQLGDYARAAADHGAQAQLEQNAARRVFALYSRAEAWVAAGDLKAAVADLMETVRLAPNDRSGRQRLAEAMMMAGDSKGAVEQMNAAVEASKEDPAAASQLILRARVHLKHGDFATALAHATDALHGTKPRIVNWLTRAEIHLAMKDFDKARSDVQSALVMEPYDFAALNLKAAVDKAASP